MSGEIFERSSNIEKKMFILGGEELKVFEKGKLTLNLLTSTIVTPPSNASKWQMRFNSAFKGLRTTNIFM
jgi:hypothetical protein